MIIMPIQWVKYTRESAIVIAQDYDGTLQPVLCVTTSVCVRYLKNLPLLNLVAYNYSKIVTINLSTLTVQSCIFCTINKSCISLLSIITWKLTCPLYIHMALTFNMNTHSRNVLLACMLQKIMLKVTV